MTTMMPMNLYDAITLHQLSVGAAGRTEATQRQYLHFERTFVRYLESRDIKPTLDELNVTNVRDALAWYRAIAADHGSRGGEVGAQVFVDVLKLWARFLEQEDAYTDSPLRKLARVKVAKRLRQPFTQAECLALWQACRQSAMPVRDEALYLLLLDTGMRIGEACTISLDKLRLAERVIILSGDGKGRRERLVPVGDTTKRDGGRTLGRYRST